MITGFEQRESGLFVPGDRQKKVVLTTESLNSKLTIPTDKGFMRNSIYHLNDNHRKVKAEHIVEGTIFPIFDVDINSLEEEHIVDIVTFTEEGHVDKEETYSIAEAGITKIK